MNSEQDALKACPFCGSNGKLDLSDFGSAMVYCSAESIGVDCPVNPETGFHDTQEQAIAAWNTRTPDAAILESHRELVRILGAASHALRSYQYGNVATDLAESIADTIDAALKKAEAFKAQGGA